MTINSLIRFGLAAALALALVGCNRTVRDVPVQNAELQAFAAQRFARLGGDLDRFYDALEQRDDLVLIKYRMEARWRATCFSRSCGKAVCLAFPAEFDRILNDPTEGVEPFTKHASFEGYLSTQAARWQRVHDHPEILTSRAAAATAGISPEMYDQAVEYHGLVAVALKDLVARDRVLGTEEVLSFSWGACILTALAVMLAGFLGVLLLA